MSRSARTYFRIPFIVGAGLVLVGIGFYFFFGGGGRVLAPATLPAVVPSTEESPTEDAKTATESARMPELPPQLIVGVFCENLFLAGGKPPEPAVAETVKELLSLRAKAQVSSAAETTAGLLGLVGEKTVPDRGFIIEEELVSEATASVRTVWNYARGGAVTKNFGLILEGGEWKIDTIE